MIRSGSTGGAGNQNWGGAQNDYMGGNGFAGGRPGLGTYVVQAVEDADAWPPQLELVRNELLLLIAEVLASNCPRTRTRQIGLWM